MRPLPLPRCWTPTPPRRLGSIESRASTRRRCLPPRRETPTPLQLRRCSLNDRVLCGFKDMFLKLSWGSLPWFSEDSFNLFFGVVGVAGPCSCSNTRQLQPPLRRPCARRARPSSHGHPWSRRRPPRACLSCPVACGNSRFACGIFVGIRIIPKKVQR